MSTPALPVALLAFAGQVTLNTGGQQSGRVFWTGVTLMDSALGTSFRLIDSEVGLGYQGSVSITGSLVAVRGNVTVSSGVTVASGFLYGVQGKITVKGIFASQNFNAGVFAQLDLSAAGTLTGQLAALWADMGATMSAAAISGEANLDVVVLTNTCAGSSVNAVFHVECLATYLFDMSNSSYPSGYATSATAGTQIGRIKIKLPSGDGYIDVTSLS